MKILSEIVTQNFVNKDAAMNYYIKLIKKSINYIEENLFKEMTLERISKEFNLSQYHFDRLFSIIVGTSFKQYILGRKLTLAAEKLLNSNNSVIDIALDLGFQYPEVFSRAFKKQFGISPKVFRKEETQIKKINKAVVIPRSLVNYNGGITLKAKYIYLDVLKLNGISKIVDVYDEEFESRLQETGRRFLDKTNKCEHLKQDVLYCLVNCHGEGSRTYTFYFGKEIIEDRECVGMTERLISKSCYASFLYEGKMSKIRKTFESDLFRWIALKEIKLNPIGIGMIIIYDREYYEKEALKILIPVIEPLT